MLHDKLEELEEKGNDEVQLAIEEFFEFFIDDEDDF